MIDVRGETVRDSSSWKPAGREDAVDIENELLPFRYVLEDVASVHLNHTLIGERQDAFAEVQDDVHTLFREDVDVYPALSISLPQPRLSLALSLIIPATGFRYSFSSSSFLPYACARS